MKSIKNKLLIAVAGLVSVFTLTLAPVAGTVVHAQSEGEAQQGVNLAGGGGKTVDGLVKSVINILSWVIGVASVIMIIVGGLRYVTSAGDSSSVSGAKNTIMYAVVGLVVALFAQAIVQYVLGKV
jgi:hypothetical protein